MSSQGGIAAGGDSNSARKSYARSSGVDIADFDVKRVLIDNGSAADVLTWDALLGLKAPLEKLRSVTTHLQGFGGATVIPEGTIELSVTLGTYPASITIVTKFLVVKTHMAYNAIYGRPLLNAARGSGINLSPVYEVSNESRCRMCEGRSTCIQKVLRRQHTGQKG
ncbi:Uncharacterized protein Adt_36434 [Abeliophyllum distichum]|uniref:Peptidase A2 domain-containing protein n=1 Tax=Abeliophyllum distichum TaxID=126358 RepID=A0ABD1QHJ1_9LAMI